MFTYNVHRFVFQGVSVVLVYFRDGLLCRPPDFSFVFTDFQEARLLFLQRLKNGGAVGGYTL